MVGSVTSRWKGRRINRRKMNQTKNRVRKEMLRVLVSFLHAIFSPLCFSITTCVPFHHFVKCFLHHVIVSGPIRAVTASIY